MSGHGCRWLSNGVVTVAVEGPVEIVRQIEQYFGPWLGHSRGRADVHVKLHLDGPPAGALASAEVPPVRVEAFWHERRGYASYVLSISDRPEERRFVVEDTGTSVVVRPVERRVMLYASSPRALANDAKDVLQRQVLQPMMLREGWSLLHAAAVAIDGQVVGIVGRAGSGKTTLQLQLAAGGADLVAADRLYLAGRDGGGIVALGYPSRAALESDSFNRFPALGALRSHSSPADGKHALPLALVAAALQVRVVPGGDLRAVLLPRRRLAPSTGLGRPLDPVHLAGELEGQWFDLDDPMVRPWLGLAAPATPGATRRHDELLERLFRSRTVVREIDTGAALQAPAGELVRRLSTALASPDR